MLGYPLEEALLLCQQNGKAMRIVQTQGNHASENGTLRVIKVTEDALYVAPFPDGEPKRE